MPSGVFCADHIAEGDARVLRLRRQLDQIELVNYIVIRAEIQCIKELDSWTFLLFKVMLAASLVAGTPFCRGIVFIVLAKHGT